jgi:hypothetical protein
MPVLPLTEEATTRRNRPSFVTERQTRPVKKTNEPAEGAKVEKPKPRIIGPLIHVLPYSKTIVDVTVQNIETNKYPNGLLAWGNIDSATLYSHYFDALIVTAEEFPFNDDKFVENAFHAQSRCRGSVYFVPISEIKSASSDSMRDKNHALQPVLRVQKSATAGLKTMNVTMNRKPVFSNQLIYNLLQEKKTILVVCMAGRNRSTTTILIFLMMLPLMPAVPDENMLLTKTRKMFPKAPAKWLDYLNSKRTTKIFEINRIQLETLLRTISALSIN